MKFLVNKHIRALYFAFFMLQLLTGTANAGSPGDTPEAVADGLRAALSGGDAEKTPRKAATAAQAAR